MKFSRSATFSIILAAMEIVDVGEDPIFLLGGPYSNAHALRATLNRARELGFKPNRVFCLGDVASFGADALECVELIRDSGIYCIRSDREEQPSRGDADHRDGFAPGRARDAASKAWFAHAAKQLDRGSREYLDPLPNRLDIHIARRSLAMIHGASSSTTRFIHESTPVRVKRSAIERLGVDGVIAGPSGLPFSQSIGRWLWHDPGVVGIPANDGTTRVWYSILRPDRATEAILIEHRPLEYDYRGAARALRAAGLPEEYANALETGLWPNYDSPPTAEARRRGVPLESVTLNWRADEESASMFAWPGPSDLAPLEARKFRDPDHIATGEKRARVSLERLETLWFNTGTRCNLSCANCYIESTPTNDRLAYLTAVETSRFLDEIEDNKLGTTLIGFTGGEPFLNREFPRMLADALERGFPALVLTNGMKPMRRHESELLALRARFGDRLTMRVSLDHYTSELHETERGPNSWAPTIDGIQWLAREGFRLHVAGRLFSGETEAAARAGYARLFEEIGVGVDPLDPAALTLFPEMDATADIPEITEACWGILGKSPGDVMCATSRMVVKRQDAKRPTVLACTLIAYDEGFELGATLAESARPVALNHPHCARFCVLGGAACSR